MNKTIKIALGLSATTAIAACGPPVLPTVGAVNGGGSSDPTVIECDSSVTDVWELCVENPDGSLSPYQQYDDVLPSDCQYEDVLAYRLIEDGFGHRAGEIICLHIDMVNDLPAQAYDPKE